MRAQVAKALFEKTKEDYEVIAEEFAATRQKVWQDLDFLIDRIGLSKKILDVGCGNGRLLNSLKEKKVQYTGIDSSKKLIYHAKTSFKEYPLATFLIADALELPFGDSEFDFVVSIAVLHHIPSAELRLKAVLEMNRVLKNGGELIVTVWNLWQQKYYKYIVSEFVKKLTGKSNLDFKDCYIPWKRAYKIDRYCHAFTERELTGLVRDCGFNVVEHGMTQRESYRPNIYAVATKPNSNRNLKLKTT